MSPLIDTLLPDWDRNVAERSELARIGRRNAIHGTDVRASPEQTWAALEQVTVGELPLTRRLMRVRGLGRLTTATDRPMLDALGFLTPLAEASGDRVVGMIGRPWKPGGEPVALAGAADFRAFDRPGWVRVATDFRVVAAAGGSRLTTETRIEATDRSARRRFACYWRVVGLGSALIRRDLLRGIRRRAEAA